MEALYELIHSLSEKEISLVKNYLHLLTNPERAESMLSIKLFDYLLNRKQCPSEKDCCIYIYGTDRHKMDLFKKLRYRFKTKLLDALCTDLNEEKKESMDEVDHAAFRVKKKSIQSRLLFFSNPRLEIARDLLEEIIMECKKFEFYNMLVEHLNVKRWRYTFKQGEEAFEKASAEAIHYRECEDALTKANNYYYKLIFSSEQSGQNDAKMRSFLSDTISELTQSVLKTKSNVIRYYLKFFEVYYYMRNKDYQKARHICSELRDIILYHPSVKRKLRLGIVYDYFSRCELFLGNFEKAAEYAISAQENFVPNSYDHSIAKEQELYALFYNDKFDEAETVALSMLGNTSRQELGPVRHTRYNYLYANVLFKQRKFSEALNILDQERELSGDHDSLETGARILSIMTAIELNSHHAARRQTESLKKFMQRNEKKNTVTPRQKIILKLLLQAERKKFEFNDKTTPLLEQLSSQNKEYGWELLSEELIPFHVWIRERIALPPGS